MCHLSTENIALMVVKALHQARVVPALNVVVRSIMDLDFDGVASIVDEEYDWVQSISDHGGHILHRTSSQLAKNECVGTVLLSFGRFVSAMNAVYKVLRQNVLSIQVLVVICSWLTTPTRLKHATKCCCSRAAEL